jgi:hypothetical protein
MMARPVRIVGDVAYVPLTQGLEAIIDAEDVPVIAPYNWCAMRQPTGLYALRGVGPRGSTRHVRMHRAIMGDDCEVIDHINGNGLDNRKCNLRPATKALNNRNMKKRSDNKSGVKGVCWHSAAKKWAACISVDRKSRYLGLFAKIEDAASAYAKASAEMHGEFGRVE